MVPVARFAVVFEVTFVCLVDFAVDFSVDFSGVSLSAIPKK